MQAVIDQANAEFWNELCGSGLAKTVGITDHSLDSLRRFDTAYFGLYPYLLPFINPKRMADRRVLEIGLGYGSVGQKLAESGAHYHGLDIAPNAVQMTNHRLSLHGLPGKAVCGSALDMPFPSDHFDFLVSIGCFHHTGSVQRCLDETHRVLKPGGTAVIMVYNKYSFRQWTRWPVKTLRSLGSDLFGVFRKREDLCADRRRDYDANASGTAAPETVLFSIHELRRMLGQFERLSFSKQNSDPLTFRGRLLADRPALLPTLGRLLGLDIYFEVRKGESLGVRNAA